MSRRLLQVVGYMGVPYERTDMTSHPQASSSACLMYESASHTYCCSMKISCFCYPPTDAGTHVLAQYVTVRNERGREMLDLVRQRLIVTPTSSSGDRKPFVLQTVQSDDECDSYYLSQRVSGALRMCAMCGPKALFAWLNAQSSRT